MPSAKRLLNEEQLAALRKVQDTQTTALADRAVAAAKLAGIEQRRKEVIAALDAEVAQARQALRGCDGVLLRLLPTEDVAALTGQPVEKLRRPRTSKAAQR